MTNLKKLFASIMATTMLAGLSVSAFAGSAVESADKIQPRSPSCQCGSLTYLDSTTYSNWYRVGTTRCPDDPSGLDIVQNREITKYYVCQDSRCGITTPAKIIEERIVCNH